MTAKVILCYIFYYSKRYLTQAVSILFPPHPMIFLTLWIGNYEVKIRIVTMTYINCFVLKMYFLVIYTIFQIYYVIRKSAFSGLGSRINIFHWSTNLYPIVHCWYMLSAIIDFWSSCVYVLIWWYFHLIVIKI